MNEDCCGKLSQCSSHGNSVESIDIENLDQLACVDSPTHRPKTEFDSWLAITAEGMSGTRNLTYLVCIGKHGKSNTGKHKQKLQVI